MFCHNKPLFRFRLEGLARSYRNLVPRAFSLTMFKMAARREKALATGLNNVCACAILHDNKAKFSART